MEINLSLKGLKNMSFITKAYLTPLLISYGYTIKTEDDIPDDMFVLFKKNIEEQMREAVRVALVSADDEGRKELCAPKDIEAIVAQLHIFPKKILDGGGSVVKK